MLKNPLMEQLRAQISSDDKILMDESFALADRIHFLLKKHNITQRQLAEKLGKKESEVSKWLSGGHNFTSHTLTKIGIAIGERIYTIPFEVENNDNKDIAIAMLKSSVIRKFYKHSFHVDREIKYESYLSELEVNATGVILKDRSQLNNDFVQAQLNPEAFRNIELSKVS